MHTCIIRDRKGAYPIYMALSYMYHMYGVIVVNSSNKNDPCDYSHQIPFISYFVVMKFNEGRTD